MPRVSRKGNWRTLPVEPERPARKNFLPNRDVSGPKWQRKLAGERKRFESFLGLDQNPPGLNSLNGARSHRKVRGGMLKRVHNLGGRTEKFHPTRNGFVMRKPSLATRIRERCRGTALGGGPCRP